MKPGGSPHLLEAAELLRDLRTRRIGRAITVLPETRSTNEYALETLAAAGPTNDGHVVFAEHQTAGRGRLGRSWRSPRGASLLFTVLLWEERPLACPSRIIMAAAVAAVRGIEKSTDVEPVVRWPNDIYVRSKKLAGILIETRGPQDRPLATAIGIGVNCLQKTAHFPPDLRDAATSLEIEGRHPVDRVAVAQAILRELDAYFAEPGRISDDLLVAYWREHSADIGARVTLSSGGEECSGRIMDIHPATGLSVRLDTGPCRHFDPATTTRL